VARVNCEQFAVDFGGYLPLQRMALLLARVHLALTPNHWPTISWVRGWRKALSPRTSSRTGLSCLSAPLGQDGQATASSSARALGSKLVRA
jgi:hypothetical protein